MRSIRRVRLAIAGLNVLLVGIVGIATRQVFFTRDDPHIPLVALKERAIAPRAAESSALYEVIWKEIDKVPPPPAPPPPPPPREENASDLLRLAFAAEDPKRPADRLVILQRVGAAEQLILRAGETTGGVTCESIEREGPDLVAVVKTVSGARGRLKVQRAEEPSR